MKRRAKALIEQGLHLQTHPKAGGSLRVPSGAVGDYVGNHLTNSHFGDALEVLRLSPSLSN